jgi:hypothetical protein
VNSFGSDGVLALGTVTAGRDIDLQGSQLSLASGTAGRDLLVNMDGAISIGIAQAGDDVIAGGGTITAGRIDTTGLGQDAMGLAATSSCRPRGTSASTMPMWRTGSSWSPTADRC